MSYLNTLGDEGWRVVTYHNTSQYWFSSGVPLGDFLLERIE